jgi:hypothetical protein
MSASPYGLNIGRNCGQRGRVLITRNVKNPKQYLHDTDPLVWRKYAVANQANMKLQEQRQPAMEDFQTRSQVIEQTRLKRKNMSFQDMCEKEYVKRVKKEEAKKEAKEFHKNLALLKKQKDEQQKRQTQLDQLQTKQTEDSNQMNTQ